MKFKSFKLKRCKDCKYYRELGRLCFCVNGKDYRKYNLELIHAIPLICFRKRRKKNESNDKHTDETVKKNQK